MPAGYKAHLETFLKDQTASIVALLKDYITDAGDSQIRAWEDSIAVLKSEIASIRAKKPELLELGVVLLEYTIPLETRRVDAILLLPGRIALVEFKGKEIGTKADIDQAAGYARDLKAYHAACVRTPLSCLLLLTKYSGESQCDGMVDIRGKQGFADYLIGSADMDKPVPDVERFVSLDAYQPLPSLIDAARALFNKNSLPTMHRAASSTEPSLDACSQIIRQTAAARRRALILISGVPGAGKTLIGLQLAHAAFLSELAVTPTKGSSAAAVFLSGNAPLVEVLQYQLKSAGGEGKVFVRGVHDYINSFTAQASAVPPHHVLIFDEAQRAFDAQQVAEKHKGLANTFQGLSEPELFVRFAERVPEWSVVVGLIGNGQEIHVGEEGGLAQWQAAIKNSHLSKDWDVYVPTADEFQHFLPDFPRLTRHPDLQLNHTIRFHIGYQLHEFVVNVLSGDYERANKLSQELERNGYHLRLTHELAEAKAYLRERYADHSHARFGMIASSRDKDLTAHNIPKGYGNPGEVKAGGYGAWYVEGSGHQASCTQLKTVVTEFGAQGLELDACLLGWGTDFVRKNEKWSNEYATTYSQSNKERIKDAMALRLNAYRVLLTRGRDACVVFIPPIKNKMRETYGYLEKCGFKRLAASEVKT